MTVTMAFQFYTFNEAFAEMTAVWVGALAIGCAVGGRPVRLQVARLSGLVGIAYLGAAVLSAPYLIYSLQHFQGSFIRQEPAFPCSSRV
jgi:hypothetical protein